ncbi:hypothetical protein [Nocardia sp. NPDC020380]|uniref:hypothetical protein n=1 Tax=Nocardia sp. NPDC020380 TaxID=3364309 RepID=UPI003797ADE0
MKDAYPGIRHPVTGAIMNTPPTDEQPTDEQRWAALVAATRDLTRRKLEFSDRVPTSSKIEILKTALSGDDWQQQTALTHLASAWYDYIELLPQLVDVCTQPTWDLQARQVIDRIPRRELWPALEPLIMARLDTADENQYSYLSGILSHVGAQPIQEQLIERARTSDNPKIRKLAHDLTHPYQTPWEKTASNTSDDTSAIPAPPSVAARRTSVVRRRFRWRR